MKEEHLWMRSMSYDICVECPVCSKGGVTASVCEIHYVASCKRDQCLHYITEDELVGTDPLVCSQSDDAISTVVSREQFTPWFKALDNKVCTTLVLRLPSLPSPWNNLVAWRQQASFSFHNQAFVHIPKHSLLMNIFSSSIDLSIFVVCCPISNHVMTPLGVLWLCLKFIYKCSNLLWLTNKETILKSIVSHDLERDNRQRSYRGLLAVARSKCKRVTTSVLKCSLWLPGSVSDCKDGNWIQS